jgi:hypothetical protein
VTRRKFDDVARPGVIGAEQWGDEQGVSRGHGELSLTLLMMLANSAGRVLPHFSYLVISAR